MNARTNLNFDMIKNHLESLTGQDATLNPDFLKNKDFENIGHTQLNELLLSFGYDRINKDYFNYIADGAVTINENTIGRAVQRAQTLSLLAYGNTKFGFKTLSNNTQQLKNAIEKNITEVDKTHYTNRQKQIIEIDKIAMKATWLLGYISKDAIDKETVEEKRRTLEDARKLAIDKGIKNHNTYLISDHLDVYIATSMRSKNDFVFVSKFIEKLTTSPQKIDLANGEACDLGNELADEERQIAELNSLNLRIFDPTQAYCNNRIDKGLSEALMLKRAKCTIYLAQEYDTLGKDSELASTLAQGKPVITFIPTVTKNFWAVLKSTYEEENSELFKKIIQSYNPNYIWDKDKQLNLETASADILEKIAMDTVENHYEKRANALKNAHPLGMQTNLSTGVAHGVLVARTVTECRDLLIKILLNKLEFDVVQEKLKDNKGIDIDENEMLLLKEKTTGSIYRAMTFDKTLMNSFWNFYKPN